MSPSDARVDRRESSGANGTARIRDAAPHGRFSEARSRIDGASAPCKFFCEFENCFRFSRNFFHARRIYRAMSKDASLAADLATDFTALPDDPALLKRFIVEYRQHVAERNALIRAFARKRPRSSPRRPRVTKRR